MYSGFSYFVVLLFGSAVRLDCVIINLQHALTGSAAGAYAQYSKGHGNTARSIHCVPRRDSTYPLSIAQGLETL